VHAGIKTKKSWPADPEDATGQVKAEICCEYSSLITDIKVRISLYILIIPHLLPIRHPG
jgi:hypothetical protein